MRRGWIVLFGSVVTLGFTGCGENADPAESMPSEMVESTVTDAAEEFLGGWSLVRIERLGPDGELITPPIEDRMGYLIYGPSGHMGVTIMPPERERYAGDEPTADEALAALSTYTSYFGTFTVNAAEGFVTHHLEGSLNPRGAGSDYQQRPALSVAESLMGSVIRRQKPKQVSNVQTSAQYQHAEIARREGLVSMVSAPLVFSGQSLGTLNVYTDTPHVFSNEEVSTLNALAELSAVAIEKARLYERTVDVEEQLRRNEQLSALGLLAAEVAHEIRNPLTVMKMLYHSLDLDFPEGDPRGEDTRVLGEKMDQLDSIVDNIVKFARNAEPQMGPVNVRELIDDLTLLTRHKLQHQGIELVRDDAADLPPVKADATQLSQAFLNLILNAAEAMQSGGTLRIATHQAESGLQVTFTDTGPGMTEAQRESAFTGMLSTTKGKGGGLGLAIVAKVTEAHGGRLEVESELGQGTQITLFLPQ